MNDESLFAELLKLSDPVERNALLDQECAGDHARRARVEELLRAHVAAGSFLERPAAEGMSGAADEVRLDFLDASADPGSLGRLGDYEVLGVIGRGGMGIVLRARDTRLQRIVAIKVLAPEVASHPQARRRFLREARAAAAVSHDHVVTIHAVDEHPKTPFLVMECVAGQSLQQKLDRRGALAVPEILRIGIQIAHGLAAAHRQGLVHRDIKPANILLENGVERVKITDFGLARTDDDARLTQTGQTLGTPEYMSPEQALGAEVDPRSDLFSLGSVLYTMCTGRSAFRADSVVAVLRRVCDEAPRPIQEVNPEIPDWLTGIVAKLMQKKPEDRYGSAQEVAAKLESWLAHWQQPASVPAPTTLLPATSLPASGAAPAMVDSAGPAGTGTEPAPPSAVDADEGRMEVIRGVLSSLNWLFFSAIILLFAAKQMEWISEETRSQWTSYVLGLTIAMLLFGKNVLDIITWPFSRSAARVGAASAVAALASASTAPSAAVNSAPRGTLGQAFDSWWGERDRWLTIGVQTVLVIGHFVCMLIFLSMSSSRGRDEQGHGTLDYRLGYPTPWFHYKVYPQPNMPFHFGFNIVASSILVGLLGAALYYMYWRIERVRDPNTSKWGYPKVVFTIWGIGALIAVVAGAVQAQWVLFRDDATRVTVPEGGSVTVTEPRPDSPTPSGENSPTPDTSAPDAAPESEPALELPPLDGAWKLWQRLDPATHQPTALAGGVDEAQLRVEDGAWRIENATDRGNFHVILAHYFEELPRTGTIAFRAKQPPDGDS